MTFGLDLYKIPLDLKKVFVFSIIVLLLAIFTPSALAQQKSDHDDEAFVEPLRHDQKCPKKKCLTEDFDKKKLKKKVWDVFKNGGSVNLDKEFVTLTPGLELPFVRTANNPFPQTGPFDVEFGIQYLTAGDQGSGVGLGINQQGNVTDANFWPNTPLAFWQDSTSLKIASYGTLIRISAGPSYIYHVVKFSYDGSNYRVTLDGFTYPFIFPGPQTTSLWFGHPSYCCPPSWSSFELDYVKVTPNTP